MRICSLFAVLIMGVSTAAMAGNIYRWFDENGQVHFSGSPPAGAAERIEPRRTGSRKSGGGPGPSLKADDPEAPEPSLYEFLKEDLTDEVLAGLEEGRTPDRYLLQYAIENGYADVVAAILDTNAESSDAYFREGANTRLGNHRPLTLAARAGHAEVVRVLLARGAEPYEDKMRGRSDLLDAARQGHVAVVGLLAGAGSDVNIQKSRSLRDSVSSGNHILSELLLNLGADPNPRPSYRGVARFYKAPLADAAGRGDREHLRLLLENGAEVNARSEGGYGTALDEAIKGKHEAAADMLRAAGAKTTEAIVRENYYRN